MSSQTRVCKECSATNTICWTKVWDDDTFICNDCYVRKELKRQEERDLKIKGEKNQGIVQRVVVRKSARIRSIKSFNRTPNSPREKFIPKQINYTSPDPSLVPLESDVVYCNNQRFQKGDIVAYQPDEENVYYAQLRGFLTDQYSRKSTVITWLVPTAASPPPMEGFDPSTYLIAAEEDTPRPLDKFKYVMHAPSEYYMISSNPDSPNVSDPFKNGYVPDPSL